MIIFWLGALLVAEGLNVILINKFLNKKLKEVNEIQKSISETLLRVNYQVVEIERNLDKEQLLNSIKTISEEIAKVNDDALKVYITDECNKLYTKIAFTPLKVTN